MWVSAVVVFAFFFIVSRRLRKEPDGLQTVAEILLNFATGHLTGQIGEKGKKYYYLILTLFTLHPGHEPHRAHPEARSLLKPYTPTANINVTFGMAIVVFFVTQYQGFKRHGVRRLHGLVAHASRGAQGAGRLRSTSSSSSCTSWASSSSRSRSPSDFSATRSPAT